MQLVRAPPHTPNVVWFAGLFMLCFSYPVRWHGIALSNLTIFAVYYLCLVACDHRASYLSRMNQHGQWRCWMSTGAKKGTTPRTDDLYDLYHLFPLHNLDLSGQLYSWCVWSIAHVAAWEPYNLHDLGQVSWDGSVLYRSCTASRNGRLGSRSSRSWSICPTYQLLLTTPQNTPHSKTPPPRTNVKVMQIFSTNAERCVYRTISTRSFQSHDFRSVC